MSFTLKKLPDEPIIISTVHQDYDIAKEIGAINQQTAMLLAEQSEQQYLVSVFELEFNFDEVIKGTNTVTRGEDPILHNPKIKENIFVTTDDVLKLAADGMAGGPFGGLKIATFDTLDEALAYVRGKIAAR